MWFAGRIGRTFLKGNEGTEESFSCANSKEVHSALKTGLDPNDKAYNGTKWFHDTPGVVHQDQVTISASLSIPIMKINHNRKIY